MCSTPFVLEDFHQQAAVAVLTVVLNQMIQSESNDVVSRDLDSPLRIELVFEVAQRVQFVLREAVSDILWMISKEELA
jgi:hypothetical protein